MIKSSFYKKLFDKGKRYIKRKFPKFSDDLLDDLIQELIFHLVKREKYLKIYKENRKKAISYFLKSLKRRVINHAKRTPDIESLSNPPKDIDDPLYYAIVYEAEILSYKMADKILEDKKFKEYAEIIYLNYYKGYKYREIAFFKGISKSMVGYNIMKGIKTIKDFSFKNGFIYDYQIKVFLKILFDKVEDEISFI